MKSTRKSPVAAELPLELSLLRFGLPIVIFLMPLLFSSKLHLSFTLPQVTFFRTAVVLSTGLLLLFFARKKIFPPLGSFVQSASLIFLSLYFFSSLVSTILSVSPVTSFFGTYFRQQGLFTELHYLLFFFIILLVTSLLPPPKRKTFIDSLLLAVSLSGSLVAGYGILQHIGIDPLFRNFNTAYLLGRIFSTLGHPNILGAWLLFPITTSFLFTIRSNFSIFPRALRLVGTIGLLLQIPALILTLSRSAYLGFVAFLLAFLILTLWQQGKKKKKWAFGIIAVTIVLGGIFVILQASPAAKNFSPENRILQRFVLRNESLRSVESRWEMWKGTFRVFLDSPFLGRGGETLQLTFPQYQSEKLLELEPYKGSVDRAHNFLLDLLATKGLFGTLFFGFFIFSLLYHSGKESRFASRGGKDDLAIPLAAGVIGFLASDFWGFELSTQSATLYLFLALLALSTPAFPMPAKKLITPLSLKPFTAILAIPLLLATIIPWNFQLLRADVAFQKSLNLNEDPEAYFLENQKTLRLAPFEPFYAVHFVKKIIERNRAEEYPLGEKIVLERILNLSSINRDGYVLLGELAAKTENTKRTDEFFLKAIRLSPKSPLVLHPYADILFEQKRYFEAKAVYKYLLKISPPYWRWRNEDAAENVQYERERFRFFFRENPEFPEILERLSAIEFALGNRGQSIFYNSAFERLKKQIAETQGGA